LLALAGKESSLTFALMATSDLSVAAVPHWGADNASAVRLPLLRLAVRCKEVFEDPSFEEPDRPFELRPVFACQERPGHRRRNEFVEFALRLFLAQITPQRCQRGKEQRRLQREG
jgi:hypothetical protein